ncbi:MAG TPA: outer membrane beta-barrel protein [Terriglobales bacterium]|nr:outer membrane beta-barrel protein [Terriglobales bacterium]
MRKIAAVFAICVLTGAARAQLPSGNVFFGYSYAHATVTTPARLPDQGGIVSSGSSGLNGWNAAAELKFLPLIGLVGDVSGHYGSQTVTAVCGFVPPPCPTVREPMDITEYHFLVGPQLSFSIGRVRPFAHVLFGAGHLSESTKAQPFSASDTAFSYALGGGIDYRLLGPLRWRVQGDFLNDRFFGNSQDNFRFSTGPVLHF